MNGKHTIYADYQSTTPVDPRVLEEMKPYWRDLFGNPHSSDHVVGWRAAEAVGEAKKLIAGLIGADPDEVVFTSGATEANNLALLGLARRGHESRRRILVSAIEHKCVLAAAGALKRNAGLAVEIVPVDKEGFVNKDVLEKMVDESVLVASIMSVNNEVGTIQDISAISALLKHHGALLHCDASQAPCAVDVSKLAGYADLISLSGHKIYGPQGIGVLYVRRELHQHMEPIIYGGGQQDGLRSGTVPLPLCVGMAAAIGILLTNGSKERRRITEQRDFFVSLLQESGFPIKINGPEGVWRHPGNANLRFDGFAAQDILGAVQPWLAASTGSACTSGMPEPSHVLTAMGLSADQAESSIRFSFGRFTSDQELQEAANLVTRALKSLFPIGVVPSPDEVLPFA